MANSAAVCCSPIRCGPPAGVHAGLGVFLPLVVHLPGEGDQALPGIPLLRQVGVHGELVAHGVEAGAGDDHGLGPAADPVLHLLGEVLDRDPDLPLDRVRVQFHEGLEQVGGLALLVARVVLDRLEEPPVGRVRGVVGEDVEDEALLDRLPHAVQVERFEPAVGLLHAEQFQRLRLGRRREREGGEVRQGAAFLHLGEDSLLQFLLRRSGSGFLLLGRLKASSGEYGLEALRTLAGLGRVRFVDDHREPLAGKRSDLLGDHRELLERRDDDPLAGFQGRAELLRILVDLLDHPERLLELGDRALKLAVEHAAIRDDDDGVEHRAIVGVVEGGELMREPCDRVALAAPGRVLDEVALPRPVVPGVGHHAPTASSCWYRGRSDASSFAPRRPRLPLRG